MPFAAYGHDINADVYFAGHGGMNFRRIYDYITPDMGSLKYFRVADFPCHYASLSPGQPSLPPRIQYIDIRLIDNFRQRGRRCYALSQLWRDEAII